MKHPKPSSHSRVRQVVIFLGLFLLALMMELAVYQYQVRKIMIPQQQRTGQIRIISQHLNNLENIMGTFSEYAWDSDDTQTLIYQVTQSQRAAAATLDQIDTQLDDDSEEQYLLANASATAYQTFSGLVDEVLSLVRQEKRPQASEAYSSKAAPCGAYARQYTQQLLDQTILDSQSAYDQLSRLNDTVTQLQTYLFLICTLSCIGMAVPLLSILVSIRQIGEASQAISQGNLDIPDVDESRRDEVGAMARAFNDMKRSMRQQVQVLEAKNEMERALYKEEKKSMSLNALMEQQRLQQLRNQINPHFLFNSLNVVLYTAQKEGAEQTASLMGSLAALFRYSIGNNTILVPLSREVRVVNEYYALCKARFVDRIFLKWEVSPEIDLTETMILPFTIQPIVGNAFRHGLSPKESGGTVVVSVYTAENSLYISVTDDGVGMTAEALHTLRETLKAPPDTDDHVGLCNVAARLLLMGEGFGLTMDSAPDSGTRVELKMPLILDESEEAEDA